MDQQRKLRLKIENLYEEKNEIKTKTSSNEERKITKLLVIYLDIYLIKYFNQLDLKEAKTEKNEYKIEKIEAKIERLIIIKQKQKKLK